MQQQYQQTDDQSQPPKQQPRDMGEGHENPEASQEHTAPKQVVTSQPQHSIFKSSDEEENVFMANQFKEFYQASHQEPSHNQQPGEEHSSATKKTLAGNLTEFIKSLQTLVVNREQVKRRISMNTEHAYQQFDMSKMQQIDSKSHKSLRTPSNSPARVPTMTQFQQQFKPISKNAKIFDASARVDAPVQQQTLQQDTLRITKVPQQLLDEDKEEIKELFNVVFNETPSKYMKKFQSADKGGRKGRLSMPITHQQHKKVVLPKDKVHFADPKSAIKSRNLFSAAKDNRDNDYHYKESRKQNQQHQIFGPVVTDPTRRHTYLPVIPHFNEQHLQGQFQPIKPQDFLRQSDLSYNKDYQVRSKSHEKQHHDYEMINNRQIPEDILLDRKPNQIYQQQKKHLQELKDKEHSLNTSIEKEPTPLQTQLNKFQSTPLYYDYTSKSTEVDIGDSVKDLYDRKGFTSQLNNIAEEDHHFDDIEEKKTLRHSYARTNLKGQLHKKRKSFEAKVIAKLVKPLQQRQQKRAFKILQERAGDSKIHVDVKKKQHRGKAKNDNKENEYQIDSHDKNQDLNQERVIKESDEFSDQEEFECKKEELRKQADVIMHALFSPSVHMHQAKKAQNK